MERVLLAAAIMVVAAVGGEIVRRRRRHDAPTQRPGAIPAQLDRSDFESSGAPWLVAVFSSDSCSTCADVISKAEVVRSDQVAVEVVSFQRRRAIHERYGIDAVPCVVVADHVGEVHAAFLGPVTATDLWAAVAVARDPDAADRSAKCDRHENHPTR